MLVDSSLYQQSFFAPNTASSSSYSDYPTELSDIFDTDLFSKSFSSTTSTSTPSFPSSSRGSTPQTLLTPPQADLPTSFPDIHDDDDGSPSTAFFSMFSDDLKAIDEPLTGTTDFMNISSIDGAFTGDMNMNMNMNPFGFGMGGYTHAPMEFPNLGLTLPPADDPMQATGIDPQLVDTPSAISDHGDDDSEEQEPASPANSVPAPAPAQVVVMEKKEPEKLTLTIAPVKVGGHGKARKGTVHSGGVVKKSSSNAAKEKENAIAALNAKKINQIKATKAAAAGTPPPAAASPTPGFFLKSAESTHGGSEAGDEDDDGDLPQDWRPPPEVLAKMTSKEKRQLRNKISARNFRVRRKEYISTLEGDIAERDRLLDHFRTQLGSRESENLALRQEIEALKKALLEGRGGPINLPPPAPLPEHSAAQVLAASAAATTSRPSSPLLTANTQKDLPSSSSPRLGHRFWGGVGGMGAGGAGGITPVHTTLVPDISTIVRKGLQENMNPALNAQAALGGNAGASGVPMQKVVGGFDGFADLNPFTMKTLDAYRMHLWSKMAAQQQMHHQNQTHQPTQNTPSGLASNLRPHFFSPSSKANLPLSSSSLTPGYGSTLSALLSGKHTSTSSSPPPSLSSLYSTPPTSPLLGSKPLLAMSISPKDREMQQQREKEQQHAMLAAMASQTIFRKLGSAFWDAFTGSSASPSPSGSGSGVGSGVGLGASSSYANWDADKVQRVLEGKAVLKVVDVEPAVPPSSPKVGASRVVGSRVPGVNAPQQQGEKSNGNGNGKCATAAAMCDILEESMRSLTLGKKM